jgi:hypothetical protein
MDKGKDLFSKHKKIIIALAVLIVIGIGVKIGINIHNNNIISKVEMKFSGYNGNGTAEISNYSSIYKDIDHQILKKEGVKKEIIDKIDNSNFDSTDLSYADQKLLDDVSDKISSINMTFKGKSTNLKNGDKVTVVFKNDDHSLPFKNGTKTFTVKGLKKTTKVSSKVLYDNLNITSSGINGKGEIAISSKKSDLIDSTISIKNNGTLKNGDKVSIKLPNSVFKDSSGKHEYTGSHTFDYTVSGLVDDKTITNVDDITSDTDTIMNDYVDDESFDDTKYTYKFINLYVVPTDHVQSDDFEDDSDSDTSSTKVIVKDSRGSDTDSNKFSIVAIYTVTNDDADSDDEPDNVEVDVDDLTLKSGKLNIGEKEITSTDNITSFNDSIKTYERNLGVYGIKIK